MLHFIIKFIKIGSNKLLCLHPLFFKLLGTSLEVKGTGSCPPPPHRCLPPSWATADVRFNYRLRLKSHVALPLFIYLYLNEDTESLIKVVIVADSVRRGSWMSDQTGL